MNFIITLLKGHIAKFLNGIHSDKCRNSQFVKVIISHRGMLNHKLDTVTYPLAKVQGLSWNRGRKIATTRGWIGPVPNECLTNTLEPALTNTENL